MDTAQYEADRNGRKTGGPWWSSGRTGKTRAKKKDLKAKIGSRDKEKGSKEENSY